MSNPYRHPISTPIPELQGIATIAARWTDADETLYTRWLAGDETLPLLEREQYLRFQARIDRETRALATPSQRLDAATVERCAQVAEARWRPEVIAFADLMERQLRANDHKPGWKRDDPLDLLDRVVDETEALVRAVQRHLNIQIDLEPSRGSDPCWRTGVAHIIGPEAADVANFAMMVADVCGALATEPHQHGGKGA